jgi:hypothetical protein
VAGFTGFANGMRKSASGQQQLPRQSREIVGQRHDPRWWKVPGRELTLELDRRVAGKQLDKGRNLPEQLPKPRVALSFNSSEQIENPWASR